MRFIDPHIHMSARTTDDYAAMSVGGIGTVAEPAFWPGYNRRSSEAFHDYFSVLTETEPRRAKRYGIRHYCWIGLNSKEAENRRLADEVVKIIPRYLEAPNALGIGEIGLNKNSQPEIETLQMQLQLAASRSELILIHTPHLEDKLKGTRLIMDLIANEPRIRPERVMIDHAEEHTIGEVKGRGFWFGLTLYPDSKGSPARAVDMLELYGPERLCINSSADWSVSDPLAILKTAAEMRRRGHSEELIQQVFYGNPNAFLGQSPKFRAA